MIAMETRTFWRTTATIRRPSATAEGIFRRSPVRSATSAVSMAAGEPAAAMATPTVARASAGASFTPSPTIATDAVGSDERPDPLELVLRQQPVRHLVDPDGGADRSPPLPPRCRP